MSINSLNIPLNHFYMLRHAESEANAAGIYSGQMDVALTELGIIQAQRASEIVGTLEKPPQIVIHSHLQRARETARPSADIWGLDMVEKPEWAEHHFGEWQGKHHELVLEQRNAGVDPPGGETNQEFVARIAKALQKTLYEYEMPLIVCHGGCFRAITSFFDAPALRIKNAVLYEFLPDETVEILPWRVFVYDPETGQRTEEKDFNNKNLLTKSVPHPYQRV